jgi:nucleoside-diphosphate-sugar epimerase
LHGPDTVYGPDGSFTAQDKSGRVPIVGSGRSVFSFTNTSDAAAAIVAALDLDSGATGVLNIVDDQPMETRTWLPDFADRLGAPAPKHIPVATAEARRRRVGSRLHDPTPGSDQSQCPYHS